MKRAKKTIYTVIVLGGATAVGLYAFDNWPAPTTKSIQINDQILPTIGHVDTHFVSYDIEMNAITGGEFWKPYADQTTPGASASSASSPTGLSSSKFAYQPPVDLANPRLRALAAALGPAYLRVSGTWANSVYFQNDDKPAMTTAPTGFTSVLTRAEWSGVISFSQAANADILTSFAISSGVRNAAGTWTPIEAKPLLDYTQKIGGHIYAAELFNEPNLSSHGGGPKKYGPSWFARDEAAFRSFAAQAAPNMKIVGPGDVTTANVHVPGSLSAEELMSASPQPAFDIISYHYYPGVSQRCAPSFLPVGASRGGALSEGWLARTDKSFEEHKALRDHYAPGAPIWLTETGGAACGGAPWDATYLDSFRFLDQMGRLAKQGVSVVFNQTLIGGDYGIIDSTTMSPRPSYWAALLWRRLMGTTVLDAGFFRPGLHVYAQCLLGQPGGVSLLAINLQREAASIDVSTPASLYALTAPTLQSPTVFLNEQQLIVGPDDVVPGFNSIPLKPGPITLAPTSINFVALTHANNPNCKN